MTRVFAVTRTSALAVRAVVAGTVLEGVAYPGLDARHTIAQDGDHAVVSESWHDATGAETAREEVRLPLALLVHVALNTTEQERGELDARADSRGATFFRDGLRVELSGEDEP